MEFIFKIAEIISPIALRLVSIILIILISSSVYQRNW